MGGHTIGVIHVKCSYVTCPEIWTVDANKYLHELGDAAYAAGQEVGGSYSYPDLPCPRCSDPGLHITDGEAHALPNFQHKEDD